MKDLDVCIQKFQSCSDGAFETKKYGWIECEHYLWAYSIGKKTILIQLYTGLNSTSKFQLAADPMFLLVWFRSGPGIPG